MLEQIERSLGLRTNPVVFFTSALFIVVFVALAAIFPGFMTGIFSATAGALAAGLGWLYILAVTIFVGFVIVVGLSRYGKLRLGPDDARPEYGNYSWFAMLFTAGIGSVLMFYGVAGPVSHFAANPMGLGSEAARADAALNFSLYHYGLHAWGVFTLAGLSLAYFAYRRGLPLRIRSAFYPIFGDRINGPIGHVIDIFTVLGTVFGVAVTLGLAGSQVNVGLSRAAGLGNTELLQAGVIAVITVAAMISVGLGLDRGIRRLGQLNMGLAIILMLFVLVVGPTIFLLQSFVQNIGYYFQNLIQFSFWNQAQNDTGWQAGWTIFIWAWQISWAPFVGMFIAKISYGRTIREFVLGVLFAPLLFTIFWFSVFGNAALNLVGSGGSNLTGIVQDNLSAALFAMLETFPLGLLASVLAVIVILIFFTTSADSGSLVLDTLTSGDDQNSLARQRIFWAASLGTIALVLLLAGGLNALSNVVTTTGLPFLVILTLMCYSFAKALLSEGEELSTAGGEAAEQPEPVAEPGAAPSRSDAAGSRTTRFEEQGPQ